MHQVFGYAATFFGVMKHPDDSFFTSLGASQSRADSLQVTKSKGGRSGRRHSGHVGIDGSRLPDIEFESSKEKRLTYQLVFQTLKCTWDRWLFSCVGICLLGLIDKFTAGLFETFKLTLWGDTNAFPSITLARLQNS